MTFLRYKGVLLTVLLALIILFLSLKSPDNDHEMIDGLDKLFHITAYFFLVLPVSFERLFKRSVVFSMALAYGGFIEILQPAFGREADFADFIANGIGISLGLLASRFVQSFLK